MKSTISAIMEAYNRVPPAVFAPLRGLTSKGESPMPPHDTADDCIRVPLHSRKHPNLFALIDPEDAELVNQYRWNPSIRPSGQIRAASYDGKTHRLMHRVILGLQKGDPDVDHWDGDGLNNRKSNLRPCTESQNQANRRRLLQGTASVYRGVFWNKNRGFWQAGIKFQGKNYHLGCYTNEIEAARAYDRAAVEKFGEFAVLNFPEGEAA